MSADYDHRRMASLEQLLAILVDILDRRLPDLASELEGRVQALQAHAGVSPEHLSQLLDQLAGARSRDL